ncbi:MAG: M16 family metallopeptidase [Sandaracinaceae bacterium]
MSAHLRHAACVLLALSLASCGGSDETPPPDDTTGNETTVEVTREEVTRESPPPSGPTRDVQFPDVQRNTMSNGLAVNTVQYGHLPLVYLRLVIRSGDAQDPADLPGLASLTASMLKEGTRSRTSAELAESVEFLGADLMTGSDEENVYVMVRALADQLDEAMELLADVARNPRFSQTELNRLKTRELNRLRLSSQEPRYLARRELYRELYGNHPYAHTDATPESVEAVTRRDLQSWHRANFVPNNALLIAVGNVEPAAVQAAAASHFSGWSRRDVAETTYAAPPERTQREVLVVDRPQSVQSVIYVGNLALPRNDADFVPLTVANQVLGGSAASRLFMDLREQRSLTYGAYSAVGERVQVGPWVAYAAVRNEVTADAMAGFVEHIERIVAEQAPDDEVANARNYLSDSFPLQIETASRVAYMVEEQQVYGLPDDYWASYRTAIRAVTPQQAHEAAREYIHPDRALIVAVGKAADIVAPLRRYGPVRVIDTDGEEVATYEAITED